MNKINNKDIKMNKRDIIFEIQHIIRRKHLTRKDMLDKYGIGHNTYMTLIEGDEFKFNMKTLSPIYKSMLKD